MLSIVVQENIKLGDNTPEWWAEKNASQCWTKEQVRPVGVHAAVHVARVSSLMRLASGNIVWSQIVSFSKNNMKNNLSPTLLCNIEVK